MGIFMGELLVYQRVSFLFFLIVYPWFGHVFSNKGRFGKINGSCQDFFTISLGKEGRSSTKFCKRRHIIVLPHVHSNN